MNDSKQQGKSFTDRTRSVEEFFRKKGYPNSICYQRSGYDYLMRLKIVDDRFSRMSRGE